MDGILLRDENGENFKPSGARVLTGSGRGERALPVSIPTPQRTCSLRTGSSYVTTLDPGFATSPSRLARKVQTSRLFCRWLTAMTFLFGLVVALSLVVNNLWLLRTPLK